jgi:hypothetical protein
MTGGTKREALGDTSSGGVACAEPGAAFSSGIADRIRKSASQYGTHVSPRSGQFIFACGAAGTGSFRRISRRYTAIALIGLPGRGCRGRVWAGKVADVCGRPPGISQTGNLGTWLSRSGFLRGRNPRTAANCWKDSFDWRAQRGASGGGIAGRRRAMQDPDRPVENFAATTPSHRVVQRTFRRVPIGSERTGRD